MAKPWMSFSHKRYRLLAALISCGTLTFAADRALPTIARVYPMGGQAGTEVTVEILGSLLSNTTTVEFDSPELQWKQTLDTSAGRIQGVIAIAPTAALGPHLLRAVTKDGFSTSTMFTVGQFGPLLEEEPNDHTPQPVPSTPVEIHGRLDGAPDTDIFVIHARKGERKLFDLRSIENGSGVETRIVLLDEQRQRVAANDDRGDFDENPLIEHTFQQEGKYFVTVDQYRGPRGFNFGKGCGYILRISDLPHPLYASPLGLQRGRTTRIRILGSKLDGTQEVYLTEIRRAEYARMTYPYTMPIRFTADSSSLSSAARVLGTVRKRTGNVVEVEFPVPADARAGLWKLWVRDASGVAEGMSLEISDLEETAETPIAKIGAAINGCLSQPGEKDVYRLEGVAGRPLHVWILAAQLGVPHLDSVLTLRDDLGKKVAENDDVVAGQGSLIGNPDSSIFYTPPASGPLFLTVRDRTGRGGSDFQYRLKVSSDRPSFQLFTTPENPAGARGGTVSLKVHLIREAGFRGPVNIWFEGLPSGTAAPKAAFRADQLFEPNADGADMIIPEISFSLQLPESLRSGEYPIRVLGVAAEEESLPERRIVEAHATVMMGPILDLWNFIRRPAPEIAFTVIEPFEGRLVSSQRNLKMTAGESASLNLKMESVPDTAKLRVANLPRGIRYRVAARQSDQLIVDLDTADDAPAGSFELSVEAQVGERIASSGVIPVTIEPAAKTKPR